MPDRRESTETFSNPAPPHRHVSLEEDDDEDDSHKLTNEDFRKLLMTPKVSSSGQTSHPSTQQTSASRPSRPHLKIPEDEFDDEDDDGDESVAARRRRKKLYFAKLMKQKEEREKELSMKYRDRARERRDGHNNDYEQTETISTTADYKAVAPDAKIGEDYAEMRKKVIQESKYLGGDMEHTHLVKGLDYALLEKVRAEISSKEIGDDDLEKAITQKEDKEEDEEQQMNFKTKQGRNIYRQIFRNKLPLRNDLFLPGRVAYVIDLEDEFADTDVPTTLIRSKADCPTLEASTTLSTNDIVINKLTQILTYLRHGRREIKKMKKRDKLKDDKSRPKVTAEDDSIYDDLGDYDLSRPTNRKTRRDKLGVKEEKGRDRRDKAREREREERYAVDRYGGERDRYGERHAEEKTRKSYFEKPLEEEDNKEKAPSTKEFVKTITDRFKTHADPIETERIAHQEQDRVKKLKAKTEIDSYAECYPGMMESADAIGDSDDEADFTKMDQGTRKGPVGRWDFDTHEEYSNYMSKKEALPKAAFQYGVKMSDGRKTRRGGGPKDEKAELDREWQKIQKILDKRKVPEVSSGSHKKTKY